MSMVQAEIAAEASRDRVVKPRGVVVDMTGKIQSVGVAERRVFAKDVGTPFYRSAKRALDIAISLSAIVFLSPVFLVVAIALFFQDGAPIIFRHTRIGKDGSTFGCLKFRSMVRDSAAQLQHLLDTDPAARKEWEETQKLKNDPRIHKLGAFLRKSSLDELPQLFNVLAGSMSIVGPRPIVKDEIKRYGNDYGAYSSVRPGLTGLWQVSGRSDVGYEQRVAFDVDYVETPSLWRDITIIFKTALIVVTGRGSC